MVVASAAWSRPPSPCCTLNWPANLFCISSSSSSPYFWLPSFWFSLCHSANAAIPSHYHSQRVYPGFLLPLISVVWSVEGSMSTLLWSFQICEEQLPGCDFFPDLLTCWSLIKTPVNVSFKSMLAVWLQECGVLLLSRYFIQADATLEMEQRDFARAALEYVCLIQEVS